MDDISVHEYPEVVPPRSPQTAQAGCESNRFVRFMGFSKSHHGECSPSIVCPAAGSPLAAMKVKWSAVLFSDTAVQLSGTGRGILS